MEESASMNNEIYATGFQNLSTEINQQRSISLKPYLNSDLVIKDDLYKLYDELITIAPDERKEIYRENYKNSLTAEGVLKDFFTEDIYLNLAKRNNKEGKAKLCNLTNKVLARARKVRKKEGSREKEKLLLGSMKIFADAIIEMNMLLEMEIDQLDY